MFSKRFLGLTTFNWVVIAGLAAWCVVAVVVLP